MSELPKGWSWTTLGEHTAPNRRGVNPKDHPTETFDLLSIPAYDNGHPEIINGAQIGSTKNTVEPGDVMISKIVPHIRRVWVVPQDNGRRQISSSEWITFRSPAFLPSFLRHYLLSDVFHRQFMNTVAGVGGSLLRARPKDVARIQVPLPPLEEQRRIATILDRAAVLKNMRERSLEGSGGLAPSLYRSFFLNTPSTSWEKTTVEQVANHAKNSMRTGPFGSQLLKEEFTESGVPVLGIDNVVHNEFRWGERRYIPEEKYQQLKRYTVLPGDVLVTIMGTNGRVAVVPDNIPTAINTKHLCCITLDQSRCLPEFLRATFLWSPVAQHYLRSTTKGAIMGGLNMGIIKKMPLELPPLKLQQEFVELLYAAEQIRTRQTSHLRALQTFTQSLQSRAFRGDL